MSEIFIPTDEKQLSEIIADANANETSLRIKAGGTRQGLGNLVKAKATLSLEKISGIKLYEPDALTLIAKAGTPLKTIEKLLKKEKQRFAFEPMDHQFIFNSKGDPTIGSIVACNISGSRRIYGGACRDALIGVRFVNGNGAIIKNGGRVMKNVTGLDITKLMACSFGSLGVLSEVAFKLIPMVEREVTLVIHSLVTKEAIKIMAKALNSPFEITGAAFIPNDKNGSKTLLRIEGFSSQVDYRIKSLKELFAIKNEIEVIEDKKHEDLWKSINNAQVFKKSKNPIWRIVAKPSDAIKIETEIKDKLDAQVFYDWGGGLIWVLMNENEAKYDVMRHIANQVNANATLMRSSDESYNNFQPQSEGVIKLSKAIARKFDAKGILNPNIMGF